MSTTTFDTHKLVRKLKEAGFDEAQAEAVTEAMQSAMSEAEPVTRKDLQLELLPMRADISLLKWMSGMVLGGIVALVLKAFFPI